MGWCWLARTSTPFIYAILAGMFFGVDTQDTHDALCARACGGKVGAGTVEAEEMSLRKAFQGPHYKP